MTALIPCPTCGEQHSVAVDPGEEAERYNRDGSGYPGYPPTAEILESGCTCCDEDPDLAERICRYAIEVEMAWAEVDG